MSHDTARKREIFGARTSSTLAMTVRNVPSLCQILFRWGKTILEYN